VQVPSLPLTDILHDHGVTEIHFLKADVEVAELQVLAGMDFTQWRPWIVSVEATIPLTTEENYLF
jgi:FkbM family methyltransferase